MIRTAFALLVLAVVAAWFLWPGRSAHAGAGTVAQPPVSLVISH